MFLIVGLGNPGEKFENTRHNIGFRVVDKFAKENNFPDFKLVKTQHQSKARCWTSPAPSRRSRDWYGEFNSEISEGILDNKIMLVKPQTFMNNSGIAVKSLYTKYKIQDTRYIFVIHDDIDLPFGKIRIVKNRGAAGHKGVESIIKELGTKDFVRFRVGIQPKFGKPKNPEKFVLQKFNKGEEKIEKEVTEKAIEAIGTAIREGMEKAMTKYN